MNDLSTLFNDPDTAGVWSLDRDRSTVGFSIKNFWGLLTVKGRFDDVSGDAQITAKGAVFGRLDIVVASLHTGIRKRDQHLCSADFFDAERFPEISVAVTAVTPTAGDAAELRSTLAIKGVTAPVSLPARITPRDDGSVWVSVTTKVDRAQFGVAWNRLGMVGEQVAVSADARFVRAK